MKSDGAVSIVTCVALDAQRLDQGIDQLVAMYNYRGMVRCWGRRTRPTVIVAGLATALLLGCLPVGGPPAGQQLVHDRTLTSAFFTASESETTPSFLFSSGPYRSVADSSAGQYWGVTVSELYAHSYGETAGTAPGVASLSPAVESVPPMQLGAVGTAPPTDFLGRLFVDTFHPQASSTWDPYAPYSSPYELTRYDPRTGTVDPVGREMLRFSPSRTRGFAGDSRNGVLLDLDSSRELTDVSGSPVFVGEDFYYVAQPRPQPLGPPSSSSLIRIRPNAEPEVLLASPSGFISFGAIEGTGISPQLLVRQSQSSPNAFMLDVDTLATTPLPSSIDCSNFVSASPSGRWLLCAQYLVLGDGNGTQIVTLLDWTTGTHTDLSSLLNGGMDLGGAGTREWRPGRDELWIQTGQGTFRLVEPGDVATQVSLPPGLGLASIPRAASRGTSPGDFSSFTADGQHCFLRGSDYEGPVYLLSVEDPTLPPIQINPQGTSASFSFHALGDGRFLTSASADDPARQEIILIDPDQGTSRSLAGGGQVVAVGTTRVLALLEWDGGRNSGVLTSIDLATGAQTSLAEDVYLATVDPGHFADPPAGADLLASGTHVAFLSRSRFASPYDGLWVTRLP